MEEIAIRPERKAELEAYARRHGQDAESALDGVLAAYFEWERQDRERAIEGIGRGSADVKAGRTRSAVEFLAEIRRKYGFPG